MTGNTTGCARRIDLLHGAGTTAVIRGRFDRTPAVVFSSFAAGCAVAANLYGGLVFGLAVPVVVGLASTIVNPKRNPQSVSNPAI
jgi:hypothetical protein